MLAPDNHRFVWGPILDIHRVGTYEIVEYKSRPASNRPQLPENEWPIQFHPYVDGRDTHTAFVTLDEALVFCVAYANIEVNAAHSLTGFFFDSINTRSTK